MIDRDPPLVSICVPTLRGYDNLVVLLRSIEAHTDVDYEVVIVDSGSRTRGFPVPMNQAMRGARGKIIVGLNDDVEVTPGWIGPLVDAIEAGAWVAAPDQTSTDGNQCICGWAVAFSRHALHLEGLWYDEQFGIWCTDVDLCKRLHAAGRPPVRVALPEPLRHKLNATQDREDVKGVLDDEAVADLERYAEKYGTRAETDKYALAP
jgi:GT2 family glycosyltransferase